MATKYPYSALAQNYIVETAITWPPPRLPCCPARDYFLLAGSTCVPLSYSSPPQCTGLLLATHISNCLPLSHPHSAAVSTFFHASRRRYCIVIIKHVQGGRDFVPPSPSAICNLALTDLPTCYCSPHLLKVGACGLAPRLCACNLRT